MEIDEPLPKVTEKVVPPRPPAKKKVVRRVIARLPKRLPEIVKRQATVSYYRKMHKGRLFTLAVRLGDASAPQDAPATRDGTLTVQPVVPGALVSPALADISAKPGSEVQFMVLPLCFGRLPNARVEFRSRGKTLERVPLKSKVARRRFVGFLLLLTIVLVGLIVWDRHVSRLEPFYQRVKEQPPPPPLIQEGAGGAGPRRQGGAGGMTLPPPPDLSKMPPTQYVPYWGGNAIDAWLEDKADSAQKRVDLDSHELSDVGILALKWVNDQKFGGQWTLDRKDRSVLVWTYSGWEVLRNFTMAEVYVAVFLLTLTVIAWILTGPSRAMRKSSAFEVAIP
jgi:hypothetical protein